LELIFDENPAQRLADDLVNFLAARKVAHVAVSGGSTPRQLFRVLAEKHRERVAWERVILWQVDERCVPPDDPQSNWRMVNEELLSKIPNIRAHRMKAETDNAAEEYESLLRAQVPPNDVGIPRLDLVLLGMGSDGHTASLFPGTAALAEQQKLVVRNRVDQLDTYRITLTYPLINAAEARWFLAAGADKAIAFKSVQEGRLPASRIRDPRWYVDRAVTAGVNLYFGAGLSSRS
jgi:6-phosphogluconolactonase